MEDFYRTFAGLGISGIGLLLLVFLALVFSSYIKIVTVLGMLKMGLGFGGLASTLVSSGLAVSLSYFVMYPTINKATLAADGVLKDKTTLTDVDRARAFDAGFFEWKAFLQSNTSKEEVKRFQAVANKISPEAKVVEEGVEPSTSDVPWRILAPSFVVSELQKGFKTGLSLLLPFLVIDLLVAIGLAALGVEQLAPSVLSFPLKVLLFVLLDGWGVITSNLVSTYS